MTSKTEIIIHATDTRPNWLAGHPIEDKLAEITRWHVEDRGWRAIGYAFLIDRDGSYIGGRDLDDDGDFAEEIGAHTKGYNTNTIGIALIGGYSGAASDKFEDHYTPEQEKTLKMLMGKMMDRYGPLKVSGHNQYANKACPCFDVPTWLAGKEPKAPRESITDTSTVKSGLIIKVATAAVPAVAAAGEMPWKNLLILGGLALIVLVASGYIDRERWKKFQRGDR